MKKITTFPLMVFCVTVFGGNAAWAAQKATVMVPEAEVHAEANADSDVVYRFAKDTQIEISSDAVKDAEGINWYKVRLEALDKYGFVRANEVMSGRQGVEVQRAAIDTTSGAYDPKGGWIFVLRAMGMAGWTQRKVAATGQVVDGQDLIAGDFELSVSPFFFLKGYLRRMVSLAGVYQHFQHDRIALGGLVFRIYTPFRVEPELRVRGGTGLGSVEAGAEKPYYFGASAAVRYPLSLGARVHVSLYVEGGATQALVNTYRSHYNGGVGMGLHF